LTRLAPLACLCMLFAFATGANAQVLPGQTLDVKEMLDIGTSTNEIAITSDFNGADLTIFGAIANADNLLLAIGQYDIIVALEGPKTEATVREKERMFGIWVNRYSMTFEKVPESYSLSSSRALDAESITPLQPDNPVGINHIPLVPVGYIGDGARLAEFRQALRRLKEQHGLYQRDASGVSFISSSLFKATLRIPANVPNGVHTVHAYLYKSGELIADKTVPLRVVKTGLEQMLTDAAHERPYLYGMFAVLIAAITGWLASLIFRKD
jgi:uncharacterized protein (TIGR02186 family)